VPVGFICEAKICNCSFSDHAGTGFAKMYGCGRKTQIKERRQCMGKKTIILSALLCSGTLAFNASSLWSQTSGMGTEGSGVTSQSGESSTGGTTMKGDTTMKGEQMSSAQITQLQQALKDKGHDPGAVDGVMSSQTQQAIRAFQQANGLQATGTVDAQTAAALGVSTSGSGVGTGAGSSRPESSGSSLGSGSGAGTSGGSSGTRGSGSSGSDSSSGGASGGASGGSGSGSGGSGS
jgi:peptidoglycan hydrolase-like protein with peptidoglycan-binding domain